jgi:hypothetical protein
MPNANTPEVISAADAAALLGLKPRYFTEKFIFNTPDFPKPYRYNGTGHRFYNREEVIAWRESQKETA